MVPAGGTATWTPPSGTTQVLGHASVLVVTQALGLVQIVIPSSGTGGTIAQTASNTLTSGWYYTNTSGGTAAGTYNAANLAPATVAFGTTFGVGQTGTLPVHSPLQSPKPKKTKPQPQAMSGKKITVTTTIEEE